MTNYELLGSQIEQMMASYSLRKQDDTTPLFNSLPTAYKQQVIQLAQREQITSYEAALSFGVAAQEEIHSFTNQLFSHVQANEPQKAFSILQQIMAQLRKINTSHLLANKPSLWQRIFSRQPSKQHTISQYRQLSKQIDRLTIELKYVQMDMLENNRLFTHLMQQNEQLFLHIHTHIAAIELIQQSFASDPLQILHTSDIFEQNDETIQAAVLEALDRRKYDLEISREVCVQSALQLHLAQQTQRQLLEKVQQSILSTVPLWQSQIQTITALGQQKKQHAAARQFDIVDATVQHTTAETAQQFVKTQQQLVQSIEEVMDDIEKTKTND